MPVYQLTDDLIFPDPALSEPDGLLAVGGDLSVERLLLAYSNGIFPWYSEGYPILWWTTDPRMVLFPDKFKISKSLQNSLNKKMFEVKVDTDFKGVIDACASVPRKHQDETWITEDMIEAYIRLHSEGYCHSVESYYNDQLVGGLYGISLGGAFFGESMFHTMRDASKVALYFLVKKLTAWGFSIIDAQQETEHLKSLGAVKLSRKKYLLLLSEALEKKTRRGNWIF